MTVTVQTIECPRCGGEVPVPESASAVAYRVEKCSFCKHTVSISFGVPFVTQNERLIAFLQFTEEDAEAAFQHRDSDKMMEIVAAFEALHGTSVSTLDTIAGELPSNISATITRISNSRAYSISLLRRVTDYSDGWKALQQALILMFGDLNNPNPQ